MQVRNLMTSPAVSVHLDTTLRELAKVLSEHRISGVPVVDDNGAVLGVVSESDIIEKERGPDEPRGRFARLLRRRSPPAATATSVGEAMSRPPVVVEPAASIYRAAWLMSFHDVNRLPVVTRGKLVGLIARADLVRHFARSDDEVASDVRAELELLTLTDLQASVDNGHVVVRGEVESEKDLDCLPRVLAKVPGVLSVESDVTLRDVASV